MKARATNIIPGQPTSIVAVKMLKGIFRLNLLPFQLYNVHLNVTLIILSSRHNLCISIIMLREYNVYTFYIFDQ